MDHNTELVLRINPLTDVIKLETVEKGVHACKQISYDTMIDSIRGSLQQDVVHIGKQQSRIAAAGLDGIAEGQRPRLLLQQYFVAKKRNLSRFYQNSLGGVTL